MGIARHTYVLCLTIAAQAQAETLPDMVCSGENPSWTLELGDKSGTLEFLSRSEMDVPLVTTVEGAEWPKAVTLIGEADTAILILENRACATGSYEARVLTQRGTTPVLLSGCCRIAK